MEGLRTTGISLLILLAIACKEDAEITSGIEGKWQGTLAEVRVKPFGLPIPFKEDVPSFATRIDFNKDGSMVVWDDTSPTEGTYNLNGDEVTVNIDYSIEDIDLSGTYTIEILTDTQLVIHTKRDDTITDPDSGQSMSAEIKVTLHFSRL